MSRHLIFSSTEEILKGAFQLLVVFIGATLTITALEMFLKGQRMCDRQSLTRLKPTSDLLFYLIMEMHNSFMAVSVIKVWPKN